MTRLKRTLIIIIILIILMIVWLWWNRPRRVDMANYVPANSLVYIEANSLVDIAKGIVSTQGWTNLAPSSGLSISPQKIEWFSWLASWTGIGPAETVVLSRTQVAVVIAGFDTSNDIKDETLKVKPRAALVAETNTGQSRAYKATIKIIDEFLRRSYGEVSVEPTEKDGINFASWQLLLLPMMNPYFMNVYR
jgi:hypothetical protein